MRISLVLCFFFALRVITSSIFKSTFFLGDDSFTYHSCALAMVKDFEWILSADFLGSFRDPGYPLFLALIYFLFGKGNIIAVYIFQAVINTLTILIIYKLVQKTFGEKAAIIALWWAGFYGFYLWYSACILREVLVWFFITIFFYLVYSYNTQKSHGEIHFFLIALTYVFLIHTDSRYLYLIPCIFLLFILYRNFTIGIKKSVLFLFLIMLLSLPWGIRNYIVYHRVIPISTQHFIPDKNLFGTFQYATSGFNIHKITFVANPDYPNEEERALVKKGLNPKNRTKQEIRAILNDEYAPTGTWFNRFWYRIGALWRPCVLHPHYTPLPQAKFCMWSLRHNLLSVFSYGLLLPFVVVAILYLIITKKKIIFFFVLPILFHTIAHGLVWGETRYRIPIDFFLIILASYGLMLTYNLLSVKMNQWRVA